MTTTTTKEWMLDAFIAQEARRQAYAEQKAKYSKGVIVTKHDLHTAAYVATNADRFAMVVLDHARSLLTKGGFPGLVHKIDAVKRQRATLTDPDKGKIDKWLQRVED